MENLIEICENNEKRYKVVTAFEGWKTAILNDSDMYRPQNISYLQKHNETDEIFVLLAGKCTLYVAQGDEKPLTLTAVPMEAGKVYNIKKGVWHTHALAPETKVFIVENENTCADNSPMYFDLTDEQRACLLTFADS